MKKAVFLTLLTWAAFIQYGAAQKGEHIVELKDGSFIRGTLVEYRVDSIVRLQSVDGVIYTFTDDEVKDINGKLARNLFVDVDNTGFVNTTSLGTLLASDPYSGSKGSFSLRTVNGWEFDNRVQVGLGAGIDFLNANMNVPLYADAKYHFRKGALTPFLEVYGGYQISLDDEFNQDDIWHSNYDPKYDGGPMLGGAVGIRSFQRDNIGFVFTAGYMNHRTTAHYTEYFWNGFESVPLDIEEELVLQRVRIGVGIVFN